MHETSPPGCHRGSGRVQDAPGRCRWQEIHAGLQAAVRRVARSCALARLRDPEIFATARLIDGEGWSIEWSALGIQIGANTLWLDAQAQSASDENRLIFAQWRAPHGLSLAQVSEGAILSDRYAKWKTVMGGRLLFGR